MNSYELNLDNIPGGILIPEDDFDEFLEWDSEDEEELLRILDEDDNYD